MAIPWLHLTAAQPNEQERGQYKHCPIHGENRSPLHNRTPLGRPVGNQYRRQKTAGHADRISQRQNGRRIVRGDVVHVGHHGLRDGAVEAERRTQNGDADVWPIAAGQIGQREQQAARNNVRCNEIASKSCRFILAVQITARMLTDIER